MATTIEEILTIIDIDIKRIKAKAREEQLDRVSAGNLVDYARLLISVERHQLALDADAEKAEIKADELAGLRVKAAALIAKSGGL